MVVWYVIKVVEKPAHSILSTEVHTEAVGLSELIVRYQTAR